jgi:hypothetical protein
LPVDGGRESIEFKLLYDAAILDYSAGRWAPGSKIDVNTSMPTSTSDYNTTMFDDGPDNYCNGWKLNVDLPDPELNTDILAMHSFLQRSSTAVNLVNDGFDSFSWQDSFDNDFFEPDGVTPNPDYTPIPMVADGATPINNALLDSFDWMVALRSAGGDWFNEGAAMCREWYVVLISDGDEGCDDSPTVACDPHQSAAKFAAPGIDGIDPVKVYTIGFSASVDAAPALRCIATATDGIYYSATNASELSGRPWSRTSWRWRLSSRRGRTCRSGTATSMPSG